MDPKPRRIAVALVYCFTNGLTYSAWFSAVSIRRPEGPAVK
jgi:hypothetical protein